MLIEKSELSKIKILGKILEILDSDITNQEASLIIGSESYIVVANTKIRLQAELNIQDANENLEYNVMFADLLDLCKVFTTKTTIELVCDKNKITFSGLQGKEMMTKEIPFIDSTIQPKIRANNSIVDAEELLVGLQSLKKMMRDVPQIRGEQYIELKDIHHKICMFGYSDVELCSFSYITDNETRSNDIFLDGDDMKVLTETIKQLKALEIGFGTGKNSILLSANGIDVSYNVKCKDNELSVEELISKIDTTGIFIPYQFGGMKIDNALQKNYVYVDRFDGKYVLTNKEKDVSICWPYKINKMVNNDIEIIQYDKKRGILKLKINDSTEYYIMPKKMKKS